MNFDPESNDVSWEGIQIFRESLHEHFLNTYQVNMSPYAIERVVLEGVSISTTKNGVSNDIFFWEIINPPQAKGKFFPGRGLSTYLVLQRFILANFQLFLFVFIYLFFVWKKPSTLRIKNLNT